MSTFIDEIDLRILQVLQADARVRVSELSRRVNLSVPAVTRRIQRLEDEGVIRGYRAVVDAEKLGLDVHGYMIGGVQKVMLSRFYSYVSTVDAITRCETIISGGKEVLLEFYFLNLDQLMDFYKSDIRKYMDTMVVYLVKGSPGHEKIVPLPMPDDGQ